MTTGEPNHADGVPTGTGGALRVPGDGLFDRREQRFRAELRSWLALNPPPPIPPSPSRAQLDPFLSWHGRLAAAGYGALHWPAEYGGAGRPIGDQIVQMEELAAHGVDHTVLSNALYMVGPVLMASGSEAQRRYHLPRIITGKVMWTLLLSEPGAGSDLGSVRTTAALDGDGLVLSGQKVWSSWAHVADHGMCLCRTAGTGGSQGMSLVVVDMHAPGVSVRPIRQMNGGASFNEVFLDGVRLGADAVVGELHRGWRVARELLSAERTALGLTFYTQMVGSLRRSAARMRGTVEPLARQRLAEAFVAVSVQRLTALRVASQAGRDEAAMGLASLSKLRSSMNRQLMGRLDADYWGTGAMSWPEGAPAGHDVRQFLLSPSASIAGGTTEVQKNAMGERVLGLPREPRP